MCRRSPRSNPIVISVLFLAAALFIRHRVYRYAQWRGGPRLPSHLILVVFWIQNSSFSALEIRSKVFWASSGFFVQASSSTWNMRTGIVTAEANSWEFISAAVYAPILINSKSMSSKYWLIPWSSENPSFHFKVSI